MDRLTNTKLIANLLAQTATVTGPIEYNPAGASFTLTLVAANRGAGTGTWTPKLQLVLPDPTLVGALTGSDPQSAYMTPSGAAQPGVSYVDVWIAAAAVAANGTTVYQFNDNAQPATTQLTEGKCLLVPPFYRWVFTYGGAGGFDLQAWETVHAD